MMIAVNVDSIDSLFLSVGFMLDKMHCKFCILMLTLQPCLPSPCPVLTHLSISRSLSANRWWYNWAVGIHCWAALQVLDQTFCWCCLLCGVDRWCHLWLTYSGARCRSFSRVESIFNPPTLARSRISHLTLSFIAHWGTCPGLAPCLALDSI